MLLQALKRKRPRWVIGGALTVVALALASLFILSSLPGAGARAGTPTLTEIMDSRTTLCLTDQGPNPDYPANDLIVTAICNSGETNQQWYPSNVGDYVTLQSDDSGTVVFQNVSTGNCLESTFPGPTTLPNDGAVFAEGCTGGTAQEWAEDVAPNGDLGFCDVYTGLCLDSNYYGNSYTDQGNGDTYQSWITSGLVQGVVNEGVLLPSQNVDALNHDVAG
jgi:hypothetical protein